MNGSDLPGSERPTIVDQTQQLPNTQTWANMENHSMARSLKDVGEMLALLMSKDSLAHSVYKYEEDNFATDSDRLVHRKDVLKVFYP